MGSFEYYGDGARLNCFSYDLLSTLIVTLQGNFLGSLLLQKGL